MTIDAGDTGAQQSHKFKKATDAFTAALMQHHGELRVAEPEPPKPLPPPPPLPPIPNKAMAFACSVAFAPLPPNRIESIQRATLLEFPGMTVNDLKAQRRTAKIVRARQIAMYLAKKLTPFSLPEIGRRFGGRDHTTVLHAVRKIEALAEKDVALATDIARIKSHLPEFKS